MYSRLPMAGFLLTLAAGCGDGPGPVDEAVTTLIVRGVVHDEGGDVLPGAVVRVGWGSAGCDLQLYFEPDTTASSGRFEVWATQWGTFHTACVRVTAAPPAGRDLQEAAVQLEVPLTPEDGPDTLTVDFSLPTAAVSWGHESW